MSFVYDDLAFCGKNVFIHKQCYIKRPELVSVGPHTAIDHPFVCTTKLTIEGGTHIAPFCSVIGGPNAELYMGWCTTIAAGSRIVCVGDEHLGYGLVGPTIPEQYRDKILGGKIVLEDYASIGSNVVVFPGITLAEGSVVGAGAVLTKNTEPWTIYVGNPAKPVKSRPKAKMIEYGEKLREI